MAQKIKKENNDKLLALGEKQAVIQKEEKRKKNLILPSILMILGLLLMITGIFFDRIVVLVEQTNKTTKEVVVKDNNILNCKKVEEDETLGLNETINYKYTFKDKKLQSIEEIRTIEPIEYSDIGPNNVNVISEQYKVLLERLANIQGLNITHNLKNDKLTIAINTDLKELDPTKVPQNDKINIIYNLNEESKSVKQKIAHSGDVLCE